MEELQEPQEPHIRTTEGIKNAFVFGLCAAAVAVSAIVGHETYEALNAQPSVVHLQDTLLNGHPDQ